MTKKTKKRGQPTKYTAKLGKEICGLISQGYSVHKISQKPEMPCPASIFNWLTDHKDFLDKYMRAREERTNARFEKIDSVIDDLREGIIDHKIARVEIDAIKWQLGKEAPLKYGDRVTLAGDRDAPLNIDGIKDAEREAIHRFMNNYPERANDMKENLKKE